MAAGYKMRAKEFVISSSEEISILLFASSSYLRPELFPHFAHIFALSGDHPNRFKFFVFSDEAHRSQVDVFAQHFAGQVTPLTTCTVQLHLVFAFGGDATLLRLNQFIRYHGEVPIISVAAQHGFYTHLGMEDIPRLMAHASALIFGQSVELSYTLVSLPRLTSTLTRSNETAVHSTALAEVYLRAADHRPRLFDIHVDGRHMGRICCEGLVVATPFGSTERNCALGGPLLTPGSEFGVLNAVAATGCVFRPVVFGRHQRLRISLSEASTETAVVVFDGLEVDVLNIGEHMELVMDGPGIELVTMDLFHHWASRIQRLITKH